VLLRRNGAILLSSYNGSGPMMANEKLTIGVPTIGSAQSHLAASVLAFAPTNPKDVFGSLKAHGKPKTLEEMKAGIEAEAKRRHARHRY
jgi:hypothetical protein